MSEHRRYTCDCCGSDLCSISPRPICSQEVVLRETNRLVVEVRFKRINSIGNSAKDLCFICAAKAARIAHHIWMNEPGPHADAETSAAPDLLEACRVALSLAMKVGDGHHHHSNEAVKVFHVIEAAIAKATNK